MDWFVTSPSTGDRARLELEVRLNRVRVTGQEAQRWDFGAHTQLPVLHDGHFYSHYTINECSDGLVAMSMDGQVKWKTDQQPPFVRGGSILADGLLLMTDGNTTLYLIEPSPAGFKPLAGAVILEPGDNWAPLALVDGTLLVRRQKELKALQVAH